MGFFALTTTKPACRRKTPPDTFRPSVSPVDSNVPAAFHGSPYARQYTIVDPSGPHLAYAKAETIVPYHPAPAGPAVRGVVRFFRLLSFLTAGGELTRTATGCDLLTFFTDGRSVGGCVPLRLPDGETD